MADEAPKSGSKRKAFAWSKDREEAARLLAEDEQTDIEIATRVGVTDRSLRAWKAHPDFKARVDELARELGAPALRHAIGKRNRRVAALNSRWQAMQAVIAARGADPAMQSIPGGSTGLLVVEEAETVMEGAEDNKKARVVPLKVKVDTGLLKELRDHERQAAQELGQWVDKIAPTNPDGSHEFDAGGFADTEVLGILRDVAARLGCAAAGPDSQGPEVAAGLLPD